jgi:hypothetical protein
MLDEGKIMIIIARVKDKKTFYRPLILSPIVENAAMKLYEIAQNYRTVMDYLQSDEVPEHVVRDTLEAIEGEIQEKLIAMAACIKEIEADVNARESVVSGMQAKIATGKNKIKSIKDYALMTLDNAGLTRLDNVLFNIRSQANGGKIPLNVNIDELPEKYKIARTVYDVNAELLRADLESGMEIQGASLGERGRHLRIS